MWQYALKIIISAAVLVTAAELSKRSTWLGAALLSLPLTSLLALVWLYRDTGDVEKVSTLSQSVFWLVLPSLVLFILLPILLRAGLQFWLSLGISCACTTAAYLGMIKLLGIFGIRL